MKMIAVRVIVADGKCSVEVIREEDCHIRRET